MASSEMLRRVVLAKTFLQVLTRATRHSQFQKFITTAIDAISSSV
jgi:hypothetical protein